jgi:hypothetical protein
MSRRRRWNLLRSGSIPRFRFRHLPDQLRSIVFVHGLQGHPRNTWTWEANGSQSSNLTPIESLGKRSKLKFWPNRSKTACGSSDTKETAIRSAIFWPYHFLPEDCPNSRILTWGYDSKISHFFDGSASKNNILSHSCDLLGDLSGLRSSCV